MLMVVVIVVMSTLVTKDCQSAPFDTKELGPFSASVFTRFGIGILEVYPLLPFDVDVEILVLVLTTPSIPDQMYVRRAFIERALQLSGSQQQNLRPQSRQVTMALT